MKKTILVLLMFSLLTTAFTGCENSPQTSVSEGTTSTAATTTAATTKEVPKQTEESKPATTDNTGAQTSDTPPETAEKREHYTLTDYNSGLCYFTTEADMTAQVDMNSFDDRSYSSTIIIPEYALGYHVVGIKEFAFMWSEQITKVTIPASVKQIGEGAFDGCINLTSVVFEDPQGWTVNGKSVDVSDPAVAAQLLTGTYCQSTWICN